MPKNRPGRIFYATATKNTTHGAAVIENGVCGVAVKQRAPGATAALSTYDDIAIGEKFAIICKGIVEIPTEAGFAKGDAVWITTASNDVSETDAAGAVPFGRIVEVAGERGTATGFVRVDLDAKDNVPDA